MPNPRYVPREHALRPDEFGTRLEIEWTPVPADTRGASWHDASQLQHRISYGVRELYPRVANSAGRAALAAEIGEAPGELAKILDGKVVMRLEHISRLRATLGHELDFRMLRGRSLFTLKSQASQIKRLTEELGKLQRSSRPPMR